MSAIEGYTTLLQSTDVSPEQAGYIERILLNTRRLSTLVGNILLLSKVSNHTMPMKQTCYRLDEQIRQAIVLLEAQWSPKQLDFDADLAEVTWRGPETLMLHVWTNLISNAVKFSPQRGLIAVALKQTDGRFEIAITDQGPGNPAGGAGTHLPSLLSGGQLASAGGKRAGAGTVQADSGRLRRHNSRRKSISLRLPVYRHPAGENDRRRSKTGGNSWHRKITPRASRQRWRS